MATRMRFGCLVVVMAGSMWTIGSAGDNPGERLYGAHCSRCHGAEGRGGARGPNLIPFDWTDERALELIRTPLCDMPPVPESQLKDAEVAQIIAYLKSIK